MSQSIVDTRMGLLDHSFSTSSDLSSWEFVMDLQSIILDIWRTISIYFLCHRKFSPRFCCTWEALHQVCLNPYKVFFHLHTRVSFWYTSKPWGFSTHTSYSITLLRRTIFTFILSKLQPMDIVGDIMDQVEVYLVTRTKCHHSILPPTVRTL